MSAVNRSTTLSSDSGDKHVDEAELKALLARLRTEHRELDDVTDVLASRTATDQLWKARIKKRKLQLRDEIARVEAALIPDIIA